MNTKEVAMIATGISVIRHSLGQIQDSALEILTKEPAPAPCRECAQIEAELARVNQENQRLQGDLGSTANPILELLEWVHNLENELVAKKAEAVTLTAKIQSLEAAVELEARARWQMAEALEWERRLPSPSRPMLIATPEEIMVAVKSRSPFHPVPTPLEHDALRAHELADELQRVARNTPEAISFADPDEPSKGWTVYGSVKALDALHKKLKSKDAGDRGSLRGLVSELLDEIVVPERNCSCHISPPCSDCVEWGGLREVVEALRREIGEER